MKMIRFYCLLFFWVVTLSVHAQDTVFLKQVEVQAAAMDGFEVVKPLLARRLDTLVMELQGTSTLSQLLIQNSPVFIKTYGPGGVATASFRGTTASHTLVLWNGLQLNTPNLGQVDFSTIPVFLADEVSLNWGSSTSENSGGLGGAVNIDNTIGFGDGLLLDLKQTYGSFNTLGSFATVGYRGKRLSFRVKAYRNSSDNDFEYENVATIPHQTMRQQNADYVDYGLMPELSVLLPHSVLSVSSWNQWNDRNLPPIMPNVFNTSVEEWTRDNFSRNFVSFKTYWPSGSLQLKSAAFFEHQRYFLEVHNPVTEQTISHVNSENEAAIMHQIANLEQTLWTSWRLNAKLQWDDERVTSNQYDGQKRRDVVSAYMALSGAPFSLANLKLTARHDWVDGVAVGLFPTATFSYRMPFCKLLSASLGYSHNYRNPSLNDLYWYPGGNENLLPENGKTLDFALQLDVKKESWVLDARTGAYVSKVQNWIQWVPTMFRYWMPENVTLVRSRGIETHLKFSCQYADWRCSLSGNYVFTVTTDDSPHGTVETGLGQQLIYIPRHHGNLFADVRWRLWDLNYTLEWTGVRKVSYGSSFSTLPCYVLHNVAVGRQINKFKVELRCHNLFDTAYQNVIWRAMPGRSFEVMLQYRVN